MMRSTWQSTDEYSIILSGLPFTEYPSQFQVVFLGEAIIGFHFNKNWNLGIQTHDFGLTLLSCQVVEWHRGMRRGGRGGSPLEETNFDRFYDSLIWCLLSLSLSLSLQNLSARLAARRRPPFSSAAPRSRWPNLDGRQMKTGWAG